MKMRKIIDLCKSAKILRLYETDEGQWISDGYALYPLWGMPKFTPDGLKSAYDITDEKWEKFAVTHNEGGIPQAFNTDDIDDSEVLAARAPLWVHYAGKALVPYKVSTGVAWVDAAYLTPFEKNEGLALYERRMSDGQLYFAAKVGFELVGILMPAVLPNKELTEHLEVLARLCRTALDNEVATDMGLEGALPDQMEMEGV